MPRDIQMEAFRRAAGRSAFSFNSVRDFPSEALTYTLPAGRPADAMRPAAASK